MSYEFQMKGIEGDPYMPGYLANLVGYINQRPWQKHAARTLMIVGLQTRLGKPPVLTFLLKPEGFEIRGVQPFQQKDFERVLPNLELVIHENQDGDESGEEGEAGTSQELHQCGG